MEIGYKPIIFFTEADVSLSTALFAPEDVPGCARVLLQCCRQSQGHRPGTENVVTESYKPNAHSRDTEDVGGPLGSCRLLAPGLLQAPRSASG